MNTSKVSVTWIQQDEPLPNATTAIQEPAHWRGLVAAGQDLSVARLLEAYRQGIFPWYSEGQPVLWWSPDPRMVLPVDAFRLHASLRKTLRRFRRAPNCEVRIDSAFSQVIRHCAERPRPGQSGTWIVPEMVATYEALHQAGYAHSVETWVDQKLIGGLYVVSIGRALFGESMFALQPDASKIALAALVSFARQHGMTWIDCQQNTRHLASLGAREMPRTQFLKGVARDVTQPPPTWKFESIYWDAIDDKALLSR
jgi:leucyl/phenylalanyl-tRNA--protein transferase